MKIKTIYINEANYPPLLREIKDPPSPLYYAGNLGLASGRCVAVVGSRKATEYGRWAAARLSRRLAENGVVVVSGMAKGIDASAHLGVLAHERGKACCHNESSTNFRAFSRPEQGGTVAVLGCGVDICYPASNRALWNQIAECGLLLSEYPPGTAPAKYRFPRRNRIISGLSESTVVVQAGDRSGALITAELAAEQGRNVYVIPGNINSACNLGSNKLLRDGATPLVVPEDILDDMGISRAMTETLQENLGTEERAVVSALLENGEMTIDQLCEAVRQPVFRTSGIVSILEMKGVICTSLGKIFIAK